MMEAIRRSHDMLYCPGRSLTAPSGPTGRYSVNFAPQTYHTPLHNSAR